MNITELLKESLSPEDFKELQEWGEGIAMELAPFIFPGGFDEIAAAGGEFYDGLKPGDPVRISSGPFAGYEAIFDMRLPGSERVRVLIQMLTDRNMPVELKAGQVQRKKKR